MPNQLPVPATPINELIQRLKQYFGLWVEARRFEPTTVSAYRQALKRLTDWLSQNKKQVWADAGIAFRNYLVDYGYSPRTVNLTLGAMRSYFGFLIARALVPPVNPFIGPKAKVERRWMAILTQAEGDKLLAAASGTRPIDLRDQAILRLMLTTGLRVSGVATADIEDIEKAKKAWILKVQHKGRAGKDDMVLLAPRTKRAIQNYLKCLRNKFKVNSGPLFRSHPGPRGDGLGGRLSRGSLYDAVVGRVGLAGIEKNITPHSLRRTAVSLVLEEGEDLHDAQQMAGHSSSKTTELYDQRRRRIAGAPEFVLDELFKGGE